jgi:hypothetical protein
MSQHPAQRHFGLGNESDVTEIKITWPNGQSSILKQPQVNFGHLVQANAKKKN